jgi:hypothetical protein
VSESTLPRLGERDDAAADADSATRGVS